MGGDLPRTHSEDASNGNFLLPLHLQAPNHHHRHGDQHAIRADVQDGLCKRQVVEARRGVRVQWVAWHREDDGEHKSVDDADEGDSVEDKAVAASWIDAVVKDNK